MFIAIDQERWAAGARIYWTARSGLDPATWPADVCCAVVNLEATATRRIPFHLNLASLGLHGAQAGKDLWTGKASR